MVLSPSSWLRGIEEGRFLISSLSFSRMEGGTPFLGEKRGPV